MPDAPRECLTIDEVIAFYEGRLGPALASVEAHLDRCDACRLWLSAVAPTLGSAVGGQLLEPRGATFRAGVLVANRYRIVRFIAQGGMGEVYEADDLDLGERVALKTVRAVLADDDKAIARLKREVSLARRVTHENVCRAFDLGTGEGPGGERVTFLTMELLDGAPLSERLRGGAMTPAEALPLVRQMAAALGAAHRVGVVHRDFKSSNVMLVPAVGGPRVVVTDFGLAHDIGGAGSGEALVGSPAYMAPEQVAGDEVGPRADVYALGVVLFEMVTGTLPFAGSNAVNLATQRLKQAAPPARRLVPSLPPAWDQAIARCLARAPAARFGTPGEVVAALDGAAQRRRRARLSLAIAAAAVVAAGGLVGLRGARRHRPATLRTAAAAVAGFVDGTAHPGGDSAWRGPALAELLSAELRRSAELRVVPTAAVARAEHDLDLPPRERYDAPALARLRRAVDADWIVAGRYVADGGTLTVDVALEDAASGDVVASVHEEGRVDAMPALAERVAARLRDPLALPRPGGNERAARALPTSEDAARLYVEGLVHDRAGDSKGARELLERAVAAEPAFPLAHSALATVYLGLRLHALAQKEAKVALDLAGGLSRVEQLVVEERYHVAHKDWTRAIEIERALWTFYPDDVDVGVELARAQALAGRAPEAVATIARLHALPPPARDNPRIDEAEALAWGKQGDSKKRLAASERAIAGAKALGARTMVADNESGAAETLVSLGDPARAEAMYKDAERIFRELGDTGSAMEAKVGLADLARSRGDSRAAAAVYAEAIAYRRSVGDEYGVADMLNGLGAIVQDFGELDRAKQLYAESLVHFRAIGEREGVANVLNNLALVLAQEGQLATAARQLEEAVTVYRDVGMKAHEASTLGNLAFVERRQGRLADARAHLARCLAMLGELGDESARLQFESDRALLEREQDHLATATEAWQALRATAAAQRVAMFVQMADVELARLAVDARRAADAERLARAAAEPLAGGASEPAAIAQAVLARALVLGGKRAEALATVERAWTLVKKSEDPTARAEVRAALVAVRAAAGACPAALREATALARDEAARETVDERLEAALARGRAEVACGQAAAGRARLAALVDEATRAGYLRIARLARP